MEVAYSTFDFIQPWALKALGVHPLLGVSEQREVLVNGIGHGRTTRDDVGVIKAFSLGTVGLTGVFGALVFQIIGAFGEAICCVVGRALKRKFVEIALVGVGGMGTQPQ